MPHSKRVASGNVLPHMYPLKYVGFKFEVLKCTCCVWCVCSRAEPHLGALELSEQGDLAGRLHHLARDHHGLAEDGGAKRVCG